ncbi:Sensor_kinase_SpoOB-type, alpha-helical domain [Paenibacillus sp. UNCCL117]|uniref:sensor histidine kinase n=1 Tax=unclassified Paenibacillus TaxID=185978 RepID=UPI00088C6C98|nr:MULTISPECIES: GHKL domain-containing protein [unclassified Paenibacillus]SDD14009.1 Sensor_kinase_SpoOB-type, alpha-helical domain [Paenibacillus sp. cl123]SFW34117.1 Sensor_kinase_SpoOB-type, alpha-helical domain [Paenibacillus sp. UNCCL117]
MSQNAKFLLIAVGIVLVITANILLYFNLTRNTLEANHQRELRSIESQIELMVEQTRSGTELFEDMIGEKLRAAAIAAQYALPSDVEQVTGEQLQQLREELMLHHLTLLKKTGDDIVLYKSTSPREIGLGTKNWGPWHTAFQELLEKQRVTMDWGQSLPNYWSGPYEVATSDTKDIVKWGYYYSGKTNYIIDPYVDNAAFEQYQRVTGLHAIIENMLKTYPFLVEVAGINPMTFANEKTWITANGELLDPLTHRAVFFGSYNYANVDKDKAYILESIRSKRPVSYIETIQGKRLEKSFIAIQSPTMDVVRAWEENPDPALQGYYVLNLTSDIGLLEGTLNKQFRAVVAVVAAITLISLLLVFILIRRVSRARDKAIQLTSETYTEEFNQMYLDFRGQRHDFLNHVSVIHSLVELGRHRELMDYTHTLVGDIRAINDIIEIGQPEFAAVIQAKTLAASNKKIRFTHDIDIPHKVLPGTKAFDMVRILGNLIDNAFEEAARLPAEERWVTCTGWIEDGGVHFKLANPLSNQVSCDMETDVFRNGYTTKDNHSGLGLWISNKLIQKNRGEIVLESSDEQFIAFVKMPIS